MPSTSIQAFGACTPVVSKKGLRNLFCGRFFSTGASSVDNTWSCASKRQLVVVSRASKGVQKVATPAPSEKNQKNSSSGGEILIACEDLGKTYDGMQILFRELNFAISKGQKIGLLGANGTGKSTLLRVIAGIESTDKGSVYVKKGIRISYLAQDPVLDPNLTVLDAVLSLDTPIMRAVREYETALAKQAEQASNGKPNSQLIQAVQTAMDKVAALDAWDVANDAEKLLEILGVGLTNRRVGELSGGQKKRVAMAATLLSKPDLVILDEPTNHMDVRVIQWMQRRLNDPSLSVLLVSHDRYFLDAVCETMVELDGGRAFVHRGNYTMFLVKREERREIEARDQEKMESEIRREKEWIGKQPKARGTKSRSRVNRFVALTEKARSKSQLDSALEFDLGENRMGSKILTLSGATALRGQKLIFEKFSYEFDKGERVGVVGQNGVGKSTFLDTIAGILPLESGVMELGETMVIGYYTQMTPPIPEDIRIIDFVKQFGEKVQVGNEAAETVTASQILERFGFSKAQQYNWAGRLSGGQKRRLFLATILMRKPNFLLLDEPTNDLDLPTIEVLEAFLESFEGCLLVASHDRSFMDNVTNRLFVLEGDGQIQLYEGSYTEYIEFAYEKSKEESKEAMGGKSGSFTEALGENNVKKEAKQRKLTYMEKKEYQGLESEIDKLNMAKEELEALIAGESRKGDYEKLAKMGAKLSKIESSIEQKTDRWLQLAEIEEG